MYSNTYSKREIEGDKHMSYVRLTWSARLKIESLYNNKVPVRVIATEIRCHVSTVYNEVKRGLYDHLNSDYTITRKYSADKAQRYADFNRASQGAQPKVGNDYAFLQAIEKLILEEKKSPAAALMQIKKENRKFRTSICCSTLYNYIRKGMFLHLTMKDLWRPRKQKRKHAVKHIKRISVGPSVEIRPVRINTRAEFGHWELDTVIGKRETGETLLVLTERLTRFQLIHRAADKSAQSTVHYINTLERRFGKYFNTIFKSITCDNGSEFSDYRCMIISPYTRTQRTEVYYCHPYSSWERGSNENQNGFIRRFIKKGTKIENYSDAYIRQTACFINTYPRALFNGLSSAEVLESTLSNLNLSQIMAIFKKL